MDVSDLVLSPVGLILSLFTCGIIYLQMVRILINVYRKFVFLHC